ncbi:MAG: hypothetical protein PHG82_01715 [Candidatus Gracilibacteria bacterium]|nr:hypothetical protein [Candidatus Gracilibacteria bacterium]
MTNLPFKDKSFEKSFNSSRISKLPDGLNNLINDKIIKRDGVVLESVDNFQDIINNLILNNPKRLNALNRVLKSSLSNITVPGIINKDGNLLNTANLDYKTSLFLLKKYGFYDSDNQIKHVYRGQDIKVNELKLGYSNGNPMSLIDFGTKYENFKLKNLGVGVVSESNTTHSLSHMIYLYSSILKDSAKEEKEQTERFLKFIDLSTVNKDELYMSKFDNFDLYNNSYKTLFGLAKYMKVENIYKYFENSENTGFEIMTDELLKKNGLYTLSLKVFNTITQSFVDFNNRSEKKSLFTGDVEFILDIDSEILNCLEVCSSLGKGVIKVADNGDVIVNSPVKFKNGSNIGIFKRSEKDYLDNIKKLLSIFKGDDAKYFFLRRIGYRGQLYKSLTPDVTIWEEYEKKKKEEAVKMKRKARNDIKEFHYESQSLTEEDIFIGKEFYCKVPYLFSDQTLVDVNVLDSDEYLFYTSYRSVKNGAQFNIERDAEFNDVRRFKITSIVDCSDRGFTKKVKLKQI